jgi:hypothetical protein
MRFALLAGCALGAAALASCAAFDSVEDASPASPPIAPLSDASADGAAAAEGGTSVIPPIACFTCDGGSDCLAFGASELCAPELNGFVYTSESGNPARTCQDDALTMVSPSTLDAMLERTFAVDKLRSATVGLRFAVRGQGLMAIIGALEIRAVDGPGDTVLLVACPPGQDVCPLLVALPETSLEMHDLVVEARFGSAFATRGTVWNVFFDCEKKADPSTPDIPASLRVAVGPINPERETTVKVAAIRVARQP